MIEQGRQPSLSSTEGASGVNDWPRSLGDASPSSRVGVETNAKIGVGGMTAGGLNKLLALLVALTLACGAAAGVAVTLAPAPLDDNGDGY
jgi:hypothetical protein